MFRKFRRLSLYKKSLLILTLIMLLLGIFCLTYVYQTMVIYERGIVDNYIKYLSKSGKIIENINEKTFDISKYEKSDASIVDGFRKVLKSNDLKIKKNRTKSTNELFVFDLLLNDNIISCVSLKNIKNTKRLGILSIPEWEVKDIKNYLDKGIYNYQITIPNNYHLYINNHEVLKDSSVKEKDIKGLERLTKYIDIIKLNDYEINNLVFKPSIKILDNNKKEVKYNTKKNIITVPINFKEVKTYEEVKKYLKEDINIMEIAKNWSLYLTDDLYGPYHGFTKFTPYLIKDSYMYEMAYGWSHNVDITFVSNHYLKKPIFTNESLSNFIIYNDNAFSCEVYLEKNMIVNGKDKKDIMHDRLYFIYYNNGYKLVNMESI